MRHQRQQHHEQPRGAAAGRTRCAARPGRLLASGDQLRRTGQHQRHHHQCHAPGGTGSWPSCDARVRGIERRRRVATACRPVSPVTPVTAATARRAPRGALYRLAHAGPPHRPAGVRLALRRETGRQPSQDPPGPEHEETESTRACCRDLCRSRADRSGPPRRLPAGCPAAAPRGRGDGGRSLGPTGPAAPGGLARLPDRGAGDGLEAHRQGRTPIPAAAGRPSSPGRRTCSSARDSRKGLSEGGEQEARHRRGRRRRPAHRHDHAAAHRLRAEPAAVDPARLDRADPRARHDQDQRGVRLRRPEAAGEDHRAEHRRADRPLRRDRLRRIRQLRRRRRRRPDLPDQEDGRPPRQPATSRRGASTSTASPPSGTPGRGTPPPSATSTAPSTSARWSARSVRR